MATGREPNLKLNVTTDTRDVNKGLKEVKQGLRDLDKTGTQALESPSWHRWAADAYKFLEAELQRV